MLAAVRAAGIARVDFRVDSRAAVDLEINPNPASRPTPASPPPPAGRESPSSRPSGESSSRRFLT